MTMYSNEKARTLDYGFAETGERTRLITRFFHGVYLWMGIALVWSAIVSWACAYMPAFRFALNPQVSLMAILGAAAISFTFPRFAVRLPMAAGITLFILYSTLIGTAISYIWKEYRQDTIGIAFMLTGGIFIVTSFVGLIMKMDLSKLHSIMIVAGIGLFLASVVNYWFASNGLGWFVTYAVVLIFPILMVTETQQLKQFALASGDNVKVAERVALVGAMMLYISFINVFISILRIMGSRR